MSARALTLTRQDMEEALGDPAQIGLLYQPIYQLSDGSFVRIEALCRWEHPRFGTMLPAVFLPAFEEAGLLGALTRRIVERAAAEFVTWDHREEAGLSVNLSASDLLDPDLASAAGRILGEAGIAPGAVTFECPIRLADAALAATTLRQLGNLGVRLAAELMGRSGEVRDAFSLAPFDEVKIGGRGLLRAARQNHVASLEEASTVAAAAAENGSLVGAIGAEDEAACLALRTLGFDQVQANVLSPARPIAEITPQIAAAAGPVLGLTGELSGGERRAIPQPRSEDFRYLRMRAQAEAFKRAAEKLEASREDIVVPPSPARGLQEGLASSFATHGVKHFYPQEPGETKEAPLNQESQAGLLMRPDLASASLGYGKSPLRRPRARELPQSIMVVEPSLEQARLLSREPAVAQAITEVLTALPPDVAMRGSELPEEEERSAEDLKADALDERIAVLPTMDEDEAAKAKTNTDFSPVAEELSHLAARLRPTPRKRSFLTRKYKLRVTHFWPRPWRRAYDRFVVDRQGLSNDQVMDRLGGHGGEEDAVSVMPLGADQVGPFTIARDEGAVAADKGAQGPKAAKYMRLGEGG